MPITLIATSGASNANSYATKAESDTYHATHLYGSAWSDLDGDDKQLQALATATRLLDEQFEWDGFVASSTQRLLWPRSGAVGPNDYTLPSNAIPELIRNAACEFARQLLGADRTVDSDVETQGIKSLTAGPVSLTFKDGVAAKVVPDAVYQMAGQVGRLRMSKGVARVVRV